MAYRSESRDLSILPATQCKEATSNPVKYFEKAERLRPPERYLMLSITLKPTIHEIFQQRQL